MGGILVFEPLMKAVPCYPTQYQYLFTCSPSTSELAEVEVSNGIYDTLRLSPQEEEGPVEGAVEETKYDYSNPNYEDTTYSLACPVYEDVVAAVGDYEVAMKNGSRFSALEDSMEQNASRFLSIENDSIQRNSRLSQEDSDNSHSSSSEESTTEVTNRSAALEESIKFDDEIYCVLK